MTTVGPYVIAVFRQATLGGVRALAEAMTRAAEHHPRVAPLVMLAPDFSSPGPSERDAAAAVIASSTPHIGAVAIVYEGSGMARAVIRAVVNTVEISRRLPYPTRTFADSGEASAWLAAKLPLGTAYDAVDVARAVRRLRRGFC
jgi:hypothetical protein